MALNGHFCLNFVFFVKFKFKIYLFTSTDNATGHICACGEPEELCVVDIFMHICGLFHQMKQTCFSGRRLTASMFTTAK